MGSGRGPVGQDAACPSSYIRVVHTFSLIKSKGYSCGYGAVFSADPWVASG